MRPRRSVMLAALAVATAATAALWSCTEKSGTPGSTPTPGPTATATSPTPIPTLTPTATPMPTATPPPKPPPASANPYPWHTNIVSTTFWVGEIFDPNASDGSQVISTYDANWFANYGGCDGVVANGGCSTERRTAANDYFPLRMTPKQNPFYLDLPFDDINDSAAYARRGQVIPWATSPKYAPYIHDPSVSLMKNRWVELQKGGATCYGQIEDAGPGEYNDASYVFGSGNARPENQRYGGAGLDVSPAINGCLGFAELDGDTDLVAWRFVEANQVPAGPWTRIITTTPVEE
jgi:hypothetical protein